MTYNSRMSQSYRTGQPPGCLLSCIALTRSLNSTVLLRSLRLGRSGHDLLAACRARDQFVLLQLGVHPVDQTVLAAGAAAIKPKLVTEAEGSGTAAVVLAVCSELLQCTISLQIYRPAALIVYLKFIRSNSSCALEQWLTARLLPRIGRLASRTHSIQQLQKGSELRC